MTIASIVADTLELVRQHEQWAAPVVFLLAFAESMAFLSLLVPATLILLGVGALIAEAGLAFWPIWTAAAIGAFLGDWISFWIGDRYQHQVSQLWPFTRQPQLLARGHDFFARWGVMGAFFGRFIGPLRAVVPLVAGMCGMRQQHFQLANGVSALIWASLMLMPGAFGIDWLRGLF
ncbi:DedA family protein [Nissabacter sp. SGAir0207]|uniref:DedA family protein n=1 Tax=Nissabacter sp. SGAir0207 TaxID=2126321 RepID=UPI0010CCD1AC|nr:DedA family protein [Nissabacter sp. SGAir0207]QCR37504.1 DedA family protein [Nissabacter sp. SGAir0207]